MLPEPPLDSEPVDADDVEPDEDESLDPGVLSDALPPPSDEEPDFFA